MVAPLHWGLGHATRCIPIIRELLAANYRVMLASDGAALLLLRKEFPQLPYIELPSYDITYPKRGFLFKWKLMMRMPKIRRAVKAERKMVHRLVDKGKIQGIISDNRFGVYSYKVPSVFITHQLNVLSGTTSFFSSKAHRKIIQKYDQCWVPDVAGPNNLSGKLGHSEDSYPGLRYIGPLSRMKPKDLPKKYDYLVLLSGPEPQRTMLEVKMMEIMGGSDKEVLLVRGVVKEKASYLKKGNLTLVDFMQSEELEQAINQSELIISRSGYTTIMDLAAMEKAAFFIPTPGQYEQKYLARQLRDQGLVPCCKQDEFNLKKLEQLPLYKGLKSIQSNVDLRQLFTLFEGE